MENIRKRRLQMNNSNEWIKLNAGKHSSSMKFYWPEGENNSIYLSRKEFVSEWLLRKSRRRHTCSVNI